MNNVTNRFQGSTRASFDFYPTPLTATQALLREVSFEGSIWEPACGDGAMVQVLKEAGYQVVGTDIRKYSIAGRGGVDFLKQTNCLGKNIVTNPPYGKGLADEFIKKSLAFCKETGGTVAMLLNLSSLCHKWRHRFWTTNPPIAIYGLDEVICYPYGKPELGNPWLAKQRYCWVVWRPGFTGRPEFWWLSTQEQ